jgi:hypothetical protein
MAGLTTQRAPLDQPLSNQSFPLATNQTVYAGARIYMDTAANLVKIGASGNLNLLPLGTAQQTVTTTSTTGQLLVRLDNELNCQWMDNVTGASAITASNLFDLCYVNDDHSVTLAAGGNAIAGRVMAVGNADSSTAVLVAFNPPTALDSYLGEESSSGGNAAFTALGVATVIHAYTGTATGTLTSTANGTLASQITTAGVTLAVGNVFFVPAGLTGLTGAVDSGPWQVVSLGATGAKWVITRPSWWSTGSSWAVDATVKIGAGDTIYTNTEWKSYNASGVIDTSDPGFYVKQFTFQATLTSGTLALSAGQPATAATSYPLTSGGTHTMPVGIFSATQSNILVTCAVPGTQTSVVGYGPTNHSSTALCTAGYVGTSAGAVFALASGQTTATDTSTVSVTVFNP